MGETLNLLMQGGALAVFLLVFGAMMRGDLRTRYEVDAWKSRAETAETTIRDMAETGRETAKSLDRLTESVERRLLGGR